MKPVGGIGSQWRDGCADRRWRHRAGEGALGSLLEGSNGILAFGQVVERLPSSPTCSPPRCPAHCSTYGRPQLILNLSIACPSCSGTQSGPAAGGGPASAGESPPMWSGRWTQRLGYTHTFDIEQYLNSGKMRHVARMSSLYVLGAVRARIRKGPIHRGDWTRPRAAGTGGAYGPAAPRPPQRTARLAGRRRAPPSTGPAALARTESHLQVEQSGPLGRSLALSQTVSSRDAMAACQCHQSYRLGAGPRPHGPGHWPGAAPSSHVT